MKLNFTRIIVVLTTVVFFYTSCKKSENKSVAKTPVNYDALSSQIALNLVQSLSGKYGGTSINDGIKAPAGLSSNGIKGPKLFSTSPFCGFVVDTAYNFSQVAGDTTKSYKGEFHFVYNCSSSIVDGYTVHDSLTNTEAGLKFSNTFIIGQNYIVKALDNTYKFVSMDGNISSSIFSNILALNGSTTSYHNLIFKYLLSGVQVKIENGIADITTGKATFVTLKNDLDSTTPVNGSSSGLSGTITFLGNHKAKLVIDYNPPKAYMVDLITGVATPI
jgi:hypothetical protein